MLKYKFTGVYILEKHIFILYHVQFWIFTTFFTFSNFITIISDMYDLKDKFCCKLGKN